MRAALLILASACGDAASVPGSDAAPARPDAAAPDAEPYTGPRRLSDTGFDDSLPTYEPAYPLWSDGAAKRRWMVLPPGGTIDKSDPDHWVFPVGTRFFKEFSKDGKRLETRLIERVDDTGDDDIDYWTGAFVWLDDESDAIFAEDGAENVRGTQHDVPSATRCRTCHGGEPGFVLSVSAIQSGEHPPPGDATTRAALGYLHANCGHCHDPMGSARPDVDLFLRLSVDDLTVEDTDAWQTAVGVELQAFTGAGFTHRIVPGDAAASAVVFRMGQRGDDDQMPPIATELVDESGVSAVEAWIDLLPP